MLLSQNQQRIDAQHRDVRLALRQRARMTPRTPSSAWHTKTEPERTDCPSTWPSLFQILTRNRCVPRMLHRGTFEAWIADIAGRCMAWHKNPFGDHELAIDTDTDDVLLQLCASPTMH